MNQKEEDYLVRLLKKLKPGFLPYPIFEQIARLTTLSIIEFVPLCKRPDGAVEVLLLERGHDDPIWPDEVHTPGTVIRPGDTDANMFKAFKRITSDELKNTEITAPHFVGTILHESKRGWEFAQVYWVEVLDAPKEGKFHPVNKLPDNLVESQYGFIAQAVENFSQCKS